MCRADDRQASRLSANLPKSITPLVPGLITDVSNNQGYVDWQAYKASGYTRVILKITEGSDWPDPDFEDYVKACEALGIEWWVYVFARFDTQPDGAAHADYLLQRLNGRRPRIIALDVECGTSCGQPSLAFFQRLESQGIPADELALYTNYDFINNRGCNLPALANYHLWLADPGAVNPPVPLPWSKISILQYDWHGRVSGISADVDLDRVLSG